MREIHHILCPVDLSDVSEWALRHAAVFAQRDRATVTVLHVANPIVVPSTDWSMAVSPAAILTDDERATLRKQVEAFVRAAGLAAADVIIDQGRPAKQIVAAAESLPADLIVIGTHGTSGFEHLVLGSVTEKVLRTAQSPVLTVPPQAHATSKVPYEQILCPVDFSDSARAALDLAQSFARDGKSALTVLYALEWPSAEYGPFTPAHRVEVERSAMAELESLVGPHDERVRTRLAPGKAYREILAVAADEHSDLIVMGVQGRNALDMMLFGSTTNQVVRRATCPVLTLRA
jgi:nucleotide-binding universal stress UspA family protein